MAPFVGYNITKDYYAILNQSYDAPTSEIKSAFFHLAKELHPDKTDGSLEKTGHSSKPVKLMKCLSTRS